MHFNAICKIFSRIGTLPHKNRKQELMRLELSFKKNPAELPIVHFLQQT